MAYLNKKEKKERKKTEGKASHESESGLVFFFF